MQGQSRLGRIAQELRGGRPRIATRLTLSLILACAVSAVALLAAWSYSMFFPDFVTFPTSAPNVAVVSTGTGVGAPSAPIVIRASAAIRWYRVRDETVAAAFVVMGFVWLLLLWWLWRPVERGRAAIGTVLFTLAMANVVFAAAVLCEVSFVRQRVDDEWLLGVPLIVAVIVTIAAWGRLYQRSTWRVSESFRAGILGRAGLTGALVAGTIGVCLALDQMARVEEEFLIAAVICAGAGLLLLIWLPVIFASESRRVRGESGHVDVRCPVCGYSLIGLRDLRCPECGQQFVLDDLLERQGFLTEERPVETPAASMRSD